MAERIEQLNAGLAGRYAIERELGRGGMATVYLAEDLKHRRSVAIKVLSPELAAAVGPERFLREIEVSARLQHPHILPLLDSGAADGLLYYVMPYVAGESLRARFERERQLPIDVALRLAGEVAGALDYAHRQGVIHRDIKPENILLADGHAVVADFGIARAIVAAGGSKLTETGVSVGTPLYMSPEQAMGSPVDGRSDQYSLACVVYEMLGGQPPFTGPTGESLVHQHLSVEPRSVTDLRPAVPTGIPQALRRALAKTPADRFESAARFAEALAPQASPAIEGAPTLVLQPPPAPRRRPWQLALVGAAAVAVAVIAWLVIPRRPSAPEPPKPAHARTEVAVLPFQNLSGEGPNAYFASGLHEELLTQLAKVSSLKVISSPSVRGYRDTSKPLRQIGEELGVGSVVLGSVQVVGQQVRVNVQFIDAATDSTLWAERYEGKIDDAFTIQSAVAQKLVEAVGAAFTSAEKTRLTAAPTANAEAYALYLQGNEYLSRPGFRQQNLEPAQQLFERAVALDPNFALAHAWLGRTHAHLYHFGFDRSAARLARARAEVETALRFAPDLPEAHVAMGLVHYASGAYRQAVDEYSIALKSLPNDVVALHFAAYAYRRLGNWKEVAAAFERAAQLSPRDADLFRYLGGHSYRYLRRYPESVRAYERALSLAPDVQEPAIDIGLVYITWQGRLDTLRAVLDRLPRGAESAIARNVAINRALLLLYERNADSLLQMPEMARPNLGRKSSFVSSALYAAWAHQLLHDQAAARAAFDSARMHADAELKEFPDDWRAHDARGMALAGLGRRAEALREARWLERSVIYRERDGVDWPYVAESRALILAQIGDVEGACVEIGRLLTEPSDVSVHTLRLYPLWDPIRNHPRFKALLAKYESGGAR